MKQVYIQYDLKPDQVSNHFTYCPLCREALVPEMHGGKVRPVCPSCGFIQFKNPAPAVTILIVDGQKVALGRRSGEPGAGKWALPSGYMEYDEDFLTAARREAQEETGLDVHLHSIVHVESSFFSPRFHFLGVYLLAHVHGGDLVAGDDLTEVAWVSVDGPLPDMAFPQDVAIIERYARSDLPGLPVDPEFASSHHSLL